MSRILLPEVLGQALDRRQSLICSPDRVNSPPVLLAILQPKAFFRWASTRASFGLCWARTGVPYGASYS